MKQVALIDLAKPHSHISEVKKDLDELQSLVAAYGGIDVVHVIQHRTHPDKNTFIGSGKVVELEGIVSSKKIDIVIINAIVNPTQIFHLTKALWSANPLIQVWDRIDLILNIFDKHANTAEAKLQIEIARIHHMGPRMYGLGGTVLSRQGGGIGTRGLGETNVELMKRHWRNQLKKKQDQLNKVEKMRERQIQNRSNSGIPSVSIIGYTNAGKTSLFNVLSNKNKLVRDAPFATLDSVSAKTYLHQANKSIFVSDTIGFIRDLPPELIDTFKSTLFESLFCDLILHVVDITDRKVEEKINTVRTIIKSLGIKNRPEIIVFNKIDSYDHSHHLPIPFLKRKYRQNMPIFLSVKTSKNTDLLKSTLAQLLFHN